MDKIGARFSRRTAPPPPPPEAFKMKFLRGALVANWGPVFYLAHQSNRPVGAGKASPPGGGGQSPTARWGRAKPHRPVGAGKAQPPGGGGQSLTARWGRAKPHRPVGAGKAQPPGGGGQSLTARWGRAHPRATGCVRLHTCNGNVSRSTAMNVLAALTYCFFFT